MQKEHLHTNTSGFSLVEILVALSVFLVFVLATAGVTTSISKNVRHAANSERATFLAEEALEVSRNLRDASPDFAVLANGTYGLSTTGNQWTLSGTSDISGIFARSVTISTISGSQKKVVATVSWSDQTSPNNSVSTHTYLTNWRAPLNGLTMTKTVIGNQQAFLPDYLTTDSLDHSTDPPTPTTTDIPITFGSPGMNLVPGTYTFTTSNNPNYSLTLSPDCGGGNIILNGVAKLCDVTYEQYTAPTITSPTHTSVTDTTVTLGATVTALGNPASISARGTCFETTPTPTSNCVAEGTTSTGVFTHARTGLSANTTYHYRGYATNSFGTSYSADGTFTTSGACSSALVGTPTFYNSSGSVSAVVSKPTGVADGDIMFAQVLHSNSTDRLNTIPIGWNLIGRHKNGNNNQALYYKVAGSGEGVSYTFGLGASSRFAATISAYRGCFNTSNPIAASSNIEYVVNNTTYRAASLSLPSSYTNVLMFPSMFTGTVRTFANPLTQGGGWIEDYDHGANSSDFSRAGYRKLMVTSGATGFIDSIGTSGSTVKHAFSVGLNPQ